MKIRSDFDNIQISEKTPLSWIPNEDVSTAPKLMILNSFVKSWHRRRDTFEMR